MTEQQYTLNHYSVYLKKKNYPVQQLVTESSKWVVLPLVDMIKTDEGNWMDGKQQKQGEFNYNPGDSPR